VSAGEESSAGVFEFWSADGVRIDICSPRHAVAVVVVVVWARRQSGSCIFSGV
jgi:hypothetical protein